jgi:hypothetical protein
MPVCKHCGMEISGPHIRALAAAWHPEHFRCAHCSLPISGQHTIALGKAWHPHHFLCAYREPHVVDGRFHERNGKVYCLPHYEQLFGMRCAAGGELIGPRRPILHQGRTYCEDHYWETFGTRCAIGGEILKGRHLVTRWGEPYCARHAKALPGCYSCARPICERLTGGGQRYADGRTVCNLCTPTAVDALGVGQRLLDAVRDDLGQLGIGTGTTAIPLRLADRSDLAPRFAWWRRGSPVATAHYTTSTQGGVIVERQVDAISILHGLPREHFEPVAAHELMHVHLFLNAYPAMKPLVEEGLCELLAALWLQRQRTREAEVRLVAMLRNEDRLYGGGCRAAKAAHDRVGLAGLLDHVRRTGRLP